MDRRRLHAGVRRAAAGRGQRRRPPRASPDPVRGSGDVRARFALRRPRRRHDRADRGAGADGRRRGGDHAGDALRRHQHLPRPRAPQGDRGLVRRGRPGRRDRADHRRLADRARRLARHLPRQPAGRRRLPDRRCRLRARVARSPAGAPRPAGRGALGRKLERARLGPDRGTRARLGGPADPGRVRGRRGGPRGVRRVGAPRRGADAPGRRLPQPALQRGAPRSRSSTSR